ncbi:MAG: NAD(P)-dependent oxidoreductase [Pseudomonadota bacterium]
MQTFPMFLRMADRHVVIAGGGEQAAQKCRLMLKTDAQIRVMAPELDDELADLANVGHIVHDTSRPTPDRFADTALVFVATGCPGLDAALHDLAKAGGATVNVVDQPDLCDALTPSIVDRDPVVVAIGTEGTAPVLARQIKTRVEQMLEPGLGDLARLAGRLRGAVAARVPREARRDLWRWVFMGMPRKLHARGAEREAARRIKDAIAAGGAPDRTSAGIVSVIDASADAADLLTLRAVQRLQEADIILHDVDTDPGVLELARRDAERQSIDARDWPAHRIAGLVMRHAQEGESVVRIHGPSRHSASLREELTALKHQGATLEQVPVAAIMPDGTGPRGSRIC